MPGAGGHSSPLLGSAPNCTSGSAQGSCTAESGRRRRLLTWMTGRAPPCAVHGSPVLLRLESMISAFPSC